MALNRHRRLRFGVVLLALFLVYVSSYLVLSRRGFAQADEWHAEGIYFLTPRDSPVWELCNYSLASIYYPLIFIDNALGTGRPVGQVPLRSLSDGMPQAPPNNA